jgi:hypothetical protein
LGDEPGGFCAALSGQTVSWPSVRIYDLAQPSGVATMNFLHPRMIAIGERAIGRQFISCAKVFLFHRHKFVAQSPVHFISFIGKVVDPGAFHNRSSRTAKSWRSYRRRLRGVGHRITASTASFSPQAQASVYEHRPESGDAPRWLARNS